VLFLGDLRIALRTLLRTPGFFALASTVLALGAAVVVVMFGVLRVTLSMPPLEGVDRVRSLTTVNETRREAERWIPLADLQAWAVEQRSFEAIAGFRYEGVSVRAERGTAERVVAARVTGPYFELLRVLPLLGRTLTEGDARPGASPVVVLSERLWRSTFDGNPRVVGSYVRLDGALVTVVGVAPAELDVPVGALLWFPDRTGVATERLSGPWFHPLGRLRDGIAPERAAAELQAIQARRAERYPELRNDVPQVRPLSTAWMGVEYPRLFRVLFSTVLLVLALACVNAAGLLLVRGAGRTHEAAVRRALGAGKLRLASQMLAEAVVIGVASTVLALALAYGAVEVLARVVPAVIPTAPAWWRIELDGAMLLFALGASAAATVGAGLYPAIRTARVSIEPLLREGTRDTGLRSARLVRWLVVAEIGLTSALLAAAGVVIASAARLGHGDVGVSTGGFLLARVDLPAARYDFASQSRFVRDLGERLRAAPGVEAATITTAPPGCRAHWREMYALTDRGQVRLEELPSATIVQVDEGFFDTFRVPVREGRPLGSLDRSFAQKTLMVNEALARSLWPSAGDALGRLIRVIPQERSAPYSSVIGVAADVRHDDRLQSLGATPPTIYLPLGQWPARDLYLVLRGPRDPLVLADAAREAVRSLDPELPVYSVRTLDEERRRAAAPLTLIGGMFMIFGAVTLALAAAGVYGVISYSVAQGAREIAIRRALGAPDRAIVLAVVTRAAWQLVLGLAAGLVLAPVMGAVVGSAMGGQEHPLGVYLAVAAVLAACLAVALLLPLWRAVRLQPSVALRHT
jgi:predicted permease